MKNYSLIICLLLTYCSLHSQSSSFEITPFVGNSLNIITETRGINLDGIVVEGVSSGYNSVFMGTALAKNITNKLSLTASIYYRPRYSFRYVVLDLDEENILIPTVKATSVAGDEFQLSIYPSLQIFESRVFSVHAGIGLGYSISSQRKPAEINFNGRHIRIAKVINEISSIRSKNTFYWSPVISANIWNFSIRASYVHKLTSSMTSPLTVGTSKSAFINNRDVIDLAIGYTTRL